VKTITALSVDDSRRLRLTDKVSVTVALHVLRPGIFEGCRYLPGECSEATLSFHDTLYQISGEDPGVSIKSGSQKGCEYVDCGV
jgi:hypothetical protein